MKVALILVPSYIPLCKRPFYGQYVTLLPYVIYDMIASAQKQAFRVVHHHHARSQQQQPTRPHPRLFVSLPPCTRHASSSSSSSRGVARRSGGRLCMSSEATSPAAAKVAPAKMEEEEVGAERDSPRHFASRGRHGRRLRFCFFVDSHASSSPRCKQPVVTESAC